MCLVQTPSASAAGANAPALKIVRYYTKTVQNVERRRVEVTWDGTGGANFYSYQIWWKLKNANGTWGNWSWTSPPGGDGDYVASEADVDTQKDIYESFTATGAGQVGTVELPAGAAGQEAQIEVRAINTADVLIGSSQQAVVLSSPTLSVGGVGYDSIPVTVTQPGLQWVRGTFTVDPSGANGWTANGTADIGSGGTYTFSSLPAATAYTVGIEAYQSARTDAVTVMSSAVTVVNAVPWDAGAAAVVSGAKTSQTEVPSGAKWVSNEGSNVAGCGATEASACLTVKRAYDDSASGGTIVIAGGTYSGPGNVGWRIQKPVTIMAEPGAQPVFTGLATIQSATSWTSTGQTATGGQTIYKRSGFYTSGANTDWGVQSWSKFPDVQISTWVHTARPAAGEFEQLLIGGSEKAQVPFGTPLNQMGNNTFKFANASGSTNQTDGQDDDVYVAMASPPNGLDVGWAQHRRAFRISGGGDGTKIVGITFDRFASGNHDPDNGSYAAGSIESTNNVTLSDVTIKNSSGKGLYIGGSKAGNQDYTYVSGVKLNRVTIGSNGATGVDAYITDGLRIEHSKVTGNNKSEFNWETGGAVAVHAGIKIVRSKDTTMRFNSVSWNKAQGIWFDLFDNGALVAGNHVKQNSGSGVLVEVSQSIHVIDNVIASNGVEIIPIDPNNPEFPHRSGVVIGGSQWVWVQRNTFTQSWDTDIEVYDDDGVTEPDGAGRSDHPGTFPWNPSIELDANLFVESTVGNKRTFWGRSIASPYSTSWYMGTNKNGHIQSSAAINRFVVETPGTYQYSSAVAFNNAFPGVEANSESVTVSAPWSVFPGAGSEDYHVNNSTVNAWTGIQIGASNPNTATITDELLLTPTNNPSKIGAQFHT